jgi:hypothetical protein
MPPALSQLLTDAVLRQKAGAKAYQRGREYYMHGHVESVEKHGEGIRASVRGQFDYTVTLAVTNGVFDYECDCPMGDEGDFCKHCVAAGLAWVHGGAAESSAKQLTMDAVAKRLAEEPPAKLAGMLLDWAKDDGLLRDRLVHYAALRGGPESAIAAAGAAFEKAAKPKRYVEYREAAGFARDVGRAIDEFERLLADGHAAPIIELCETGIHALSASAEMVHDDGEIYDLTERLSEIHLSACLQARPDPIGLATRLFHLEIDDSFDAFNRAAETYAEVLGTTGLFAYKLLAEAPAYAKRYGIAGIRESIARAAGDIDGLIANIQRDLSYAHRYTYIAKTCLDAGRREQALGWAEKGLKAFPKDFALREMAANEYHHRNEHGKAMKLIWAAYTESPGLQQYRNLREHAKQAADWPEWRDNAIGVIRQRIAAAKGKADHSSLVEIFLDEGEKEEAWREAQKGGCFAHLWLALAEAREKDHPGDAAPIYLRQIEDEVSRTSNGDYSRPVALLIRTAAVMKRIDASAAFGRQLETLRIKYKIKRNFIKLVDKHSKQLRQL